MNPKHRTDAGERAIDSMREVADALAVPAIIWDRERRVVDSNAALERRFGRAFREALRDRSLAEVVELVDARDDSGGLGRRFRVVIGGEVLFLAPVIVCRERSASCCATAYVDVTTLAVQDSERAVRASSTMLDSVGSELTRELNNLVTALIGVSDSLDALSPSHARDAIADDLRSMIELCADVSMMMRAAEPAEAEPDTEVRFDPVPTLERVARAHDGDGVSVVVDARRGGLIECCPRAFERALHNATRNGAAAARSTASGGSPGRVVLALKTDVEASVLCFTVEDDGPGFVPGFHREGAGLAQIRRFARSVGGTMDIGTSRLGGARLALEIPAAPHR